MNKNTLFDLGQIVGTPGAIDALRAANQDPSEFLDRHSTGDWGTMDEEDTAANDQAVMDGTRIFSAYVLKTGVKIWLITENNRQFSTLLLPEEY